MAKSPPTPPPAPPEPASEATLEVAPEATPEVAPEVAAPQPEPEEAPKAKSRKWWRGTAQFSKSRHAPGNDDVPEGATSGPGQLFCVCDEHAWMGQYPKHFNIYPPPVRKD